MNCYGCHIYSSIKKNGDNHFGEGGVYLLVGPYAADIHKAVAASGDSPSERVSSVVSRVSHAAALDCGQSGAASLGKDLEIVLENGSSCCRLANCVRLCS